MPVTWDDSKERQFLLSIIHAQGATAAPNWNAVQQLMGDEYTANGLRQKFDKMKKAAKEQFGEMKTLEAGGEVGAATDSVPATPKKTPVKRRGKKADGEGGESGGGAKKSTGKRKSAAKVTAGGDEEVEGEGEGGWEMQETPSKKVKIDEVAGVDSEVEGEDELH